MNIPSIFSRHTQSLLAIAVALALSGCGGSGGSDTAQSNAAPDSESTTVVADGDAAPKPDPQDLGSIEQPDEGADETAPELPAISDPGETDTAIIDLGELVQTRSQAAADNHGAARVGVARASAITASAAQLNQRLRWKSASNGSRIATIQFQSNGAFEMRIGLLVDDMPAGALLRTYPSASRAEAMQTSGSRIKEIIALNQEAGDVSNEARTWWTPSISGDAVTLEIELPSGTSPDQLKVSVPEIIHVYENPASGYTRVNASGALSTRSVGESASCHLDSSCYPDYATTRNSVVLINYYDGGYYYQCTATLLNNARLDRTPYVATASHCISRQTAASTMESSWFFTSTGCNAKTYKTRTRTAGGAKLLYSTSSRDFTLVQLNDTPPVGATFAGWSAAAMAANMPVVGVHHPMGDLQKISFGKITGTTECYALSGSIYCGTSATPSGNMYRIAWDQGATEWGSSGSPLFYNNRFIGALSGGSSSCHGGGEDIYTRFDLVYPAIKAWLAPSNS